METNNINTYVAPEVEVVEIEVEKGFTVSDMNPGSGN